MRTITLGVFATLLILLSSCIPSKEEPKPVPPPEVQVYQVQAQDVPIHREYVGQVYGFKDIAIRARVEGYLEEIHFEEGSQIEKGKLLYTLESQQYEENVAAKASMVAEAKTMLAKAQSDLNRIKPLAEENAVSQSDLDAAMAQYDASVSSVEAAEAVLRASQIQLSYTEIYSQVSGIIGKTKAKVGDFVGRDPNPVILNTVSQIDKVLVQFFITETEYLRYARYLLSKDESVEDKSEDTDKSRQSTLNLILADGFVYEHKGKFDFVDREVDSSTGALLIQASFPNPDLLLRPGQFAKIRARVKDVTNGILVPQRCVTELQGLYSVYVVDGNNKVQQRDVVTGPKINNFWLITENLKHGEKVVYEGLQKVSDGVTVNPVVKEIEITNQESK